MLIKNPLLNKLKQWNPCSCDSYQCFPFQICSLRSHPSYLTQNTFANHYTALNSSPAISSKLSSKSFATNSSIVKNQLGMAIHQIDEHISKQAVRPREPRSGISIHIILREALMHVPIRRTRLQQLQTLHDLVRILHSKPISQLTSEVYARMIIDIGQMYPGPTCGPPIPSPAVPLKK